MKRRLVLISTGVILLGIGIAVAVGSGEADPMISLSYWENTYLPSLTEDLQARAAEDTKDIYQAAVGRLEQTDVQGQTGGFTTVQLQTGDTLELSQGGSAVIQGGACSLGVGTLADVTAGSEVIAGEDLQTAHRYVVTSDRAVLRQTRAGAVAYQGPGTLTRQSEGTSPGQSGVGGNVSGALPFTDVTQDHWFYSAVAFAYEKGYFSGTGATTFAPNDPMNRAMVATVLHRVAGSGAATAGQVFSDVPAGQWYSAGIAWASEKGVVNGMGDGRYAPDTPVTREQLVTMLYRFQKDYRKKAAPTTGDLNVFPDRAAISDWARDAVSWAVGAGLLRGRDTGYLDPAGTASRAEVATILQRFSSLG